MKWSSRHTLTMERDDGYGKTTKGFMENIHTDRANQRLSALS